MGICYHSVWSEHGQAAGPRMQTEEEEQGRVRKEKYESRKHAQETRTHVNHMCHQLHQHSHHVSQSFAGMDKRFDAMERAIIDLAASVRRLESPEEVDRDRTWTGDSSFWHHPTGSS